MSTADYVATYERMNADTRRLSVRLSCPWGDLNKAPATLYAGGAIDADPVAEALPDLVQLAELPPAVEAVAELAPMMIELAAAPTSAAPALAAWQSAARRSGTEPAAVVSEAEALAGACLARYGCTDPAACWHLASFGTWHAATLASIRATVAAPTPAPARAGKPASEATQAPHPRMADALAILAAAVTPQALPAMPPVDIPSQSAPAAEPEASQAPTAAQLAESQPADFGPVGGMQPTHPRRWLRLLHASSGSSRRTCPPLAARPSRGAGALAGQAIDHWRLGMPGLPWHPPPPVAASTLAHPPPVAASTRQQGPP